MPKRISICLWTICLAMCSPLLAMASSFSVNPVRIDVSQVRPNSLLQIRNLTDESVTVQIRIVAWTSDGKGERLADTDEVLVSPPIATLGAQQAQFVRLGLRRPGATSVERCFRVILEEVPKAPEPGFRGLKTILRISIPFFVQPTTAQPMHVSWEADCLPDGSLRLMATNHSNVHVQFKSLELRDASVQPVRQKGPMYLLPNANREWVFAGRSCTADRMSVQALTDAGELHETVEFKHR